MRDGEPGARLQATRIIRCRLVAICDFVLRCVFEQIKIHKAKKAQHVCSHIVQWACTLSLALAADLLSGPQLWAAEGVFFLGVVGERLAQILKGP